LLPVAASFTSAIENFQFFSEFASRARKRFSAPFLKDAEKISVPRNPSCYTSVGTPAITLLQPWERRIYFDSDAGGRPWIYYGDEKLSVPECDYAKLF
jgi:hypothetical protein